MTRRLTVHERDNACMYKQVTIGVTMIRKHMIDHIKFLMEQFYVYMLEMWDKV